MKYEIKYNLAITTPLKKMKCAKYSVWIPCECTKCKNYA